MPSLFNSFSKGFCKYPRKYGIAVANNVGGIGKILFILLKIRSWRALLLYPPNGGAPVAFAFDELALGIYDCV